MTVNRRSVRRNRPWSAGRISSASLPNQPLNREGGGDMSLRIAITIGTETLTATLLQIIVADAIWN